MDWTSKPPLGTSLKRDDPLNLGLTGFWPLWEGNGRRCFDISGNNWSGTEAEATADPRLLWTGGRAGGMARLFDGSNDRIEIPDLYMPAGASDPYTVSFWFRTSTTGDRGIWTMYNGITGTRALIRIQTTDKLALWAGGATIVSSPSAVTDGRWHYGCVVKRGNGTNEVELWVDGARVATGTHNAGYDQAAPIRIGGNAATANYFSGAIEDVRFWKGRALTGSEIQRLYAAPWSVFEPANEVFYFVSDSGISGAGSITEAADTVSSAGTVDVQGAGSITEAADTVSGAGEVATLTPVDAAGAITEASDTLAATAVTRAFVEGNTNVFYLKPRPTRFTVSARPTRWTARRAA